MRRRRREIGRLAVAAGSVACLFTLARDLPGFVLEKPRNIEGLGRPEPIGRKGNKRAVIYSSITVHTPRYSTLI